MNTLKVMNAINVFGPRGLSGEKRKNGQTDCEDGVFFIRIVKMMDFP